MILSCISLIRTLDKVFEYKLSTPGDIRTASFARSQSITNDPTDCFFGDNKFFNVTTNKLETYNYTGQPNTIYDVKLTGGGKGYQFPPGVSIASSTNVALRLLLLQFLERVVL